MSEGVDHWQFSVINKFTGSKIYDKSGNGKIPDKFIFKGSDNSGVRVADGTYFARLPVNYNNGALRIAETDDFFIDTLPPVVVLDSPVKLFSPNADGISDLAGFLPAFRGKRTERGASSVITPSC